MKRDICGREIPTRKASDNITGFLLDIRDRLQRIEAQLNFDNNIREVPTRHASDDDTLLLNRLLPAIGGAFGSRSFLVSDLFKDPVLRALLAELNASPKKIGRVFARNKDLLITGLCITRVTDEHNRAVWAVLKPLKPPDTLPLEP